MVMIVGHLLMHLHQISPLSEVAKVCLTFMHAKLFVRQCLLIQNGAKVLTCYSHNRLSPFPSYSKGVLQPCVKSGDHLLPAFKGKLHVC